MIPIQSLKFHFSDYLSRMAVRQLPPSDVVDLVHQKRVSCTNSIS